VVGDHLKVESLLKLAGYKEKEHTYRARYATPDIRQMSGLYQKKHDGFLIPTKDGVWTLNQSGLSKIAEKTPLLSASSIDLDNLDDNIQGILLGGAHMDLGDFITTVHDTCPTLVN
jgi:hypothetical protein